MPKAARASPKLTQNRRKFAFGLSGALGDASRLPGDASKTVLGCARDGLRPFVSSVPKSLQDRPGSARRISGSRRDMAGTHHERVGTVHHGPPFKGLVQIAFATNFCQFCLVSLKLRVLVPMFCTLRTKLAPNAHGSRKTTKIDVFRPQNRPREPRNRARAARGERKIARGSAKNLRIFKSRVERAGQSALRARIERMLQRK